MPEGGLAPCVPIQDERAEVDEAEDDALVLGSRPSGLGEVADMPGEGSVLCVHIQDERAEVDDAGAEELALRSRQSGLGE
eukprot:3620253-Alexandrium_andersonii.AAC.1